MIAKADSVTSSGFWLAASALAAAFAVYASVVGYRSDDGYIALQYAKNFAAGRGLVYNPGEPIEGYGSFLWVVLLGAMARWLPIDLVILGEGAGIALGGATVLLLAWFGGGLAGQRGLRALLAPAFLSVHGSFVAWSTGAVGTPLFAFLALAAAVAHATYLVDSSRWRCVPLCFGVATLARPEAALLFAVTGLHFLWWENRAGRAVVSTRAVAYGLLFLAVVVPHELFRLTYYGDLFPNVAHAKVGMDLEGLSLGARYVGSYVNRYGVLALAFAPALFLLRRQRHAWPGYFAAVVGADLGYVIWVGGDGLAFHRFVAHTAPLLYALVAAGMLAAWDRGAARWPVRQALRVGIATVVVAFALWTTTRAIAVPLLVPEGSTFTERQSTLTFPGDGTLHDYVWFDDYFVDRLAAAARWLEANAPDGSLVASTPAGSIAYHMRHPVLDMLGLNDRHIARTAPGEVGFRRPGHMKGDGRYVLSRNPTHILMGNVAVLPFPIDDDMTMEKKLVRKSEIELWALPEFHQRYERVTVRLAASGPFQWFTFYRRRDLGSHPSERETR